MICIQICSELEWQAVKEILNVQPRNLAFYPYGEFFNHFIMDEPCLFFCSGDTKTKSAAACQFAIDHWYPEILLVLGTCGGVAEHLNLLDVVVADRTAQYDCIIRMAGENHFFYPSLDVTLNNSWIDFSRFEEKIHRGLVATADQDIDQRTRQDLMERGVLAADWESGAISFVCQANKIPCCMVRGVTDLPTGDDEGQGRDYGTNTPLIMGKLIKKILPCLVEQIQLRREVGKYSSITSPYIKNLMAATPWENREKIDALIQLQRWIVKPPYGFSANAGFRLLKQNYEKEYLELLKEHSQDDYEKELGRMAVEREKEEAARERLDWEENVLKKDWMNAGGGE
jgi:nucleoside phosphorylase